ncbi:MULTISPECIES: polysialyltransferase family glycosyltransferase [unclassified Streptomyces]|uniref:polysialyltransferase family glycosyltransferase n=1 Tax=unclassified Streptomyces TaxID=2593676 RepID=UPI002ECFC817|nr:alpha-2,8-polysialyltransferase family protein [Streptomyces sp. NBC_00891]WSY07359.1 alpha-2,8-polysialyltransferase family protein [Streptomyces sp. NBC_00890]WSZ08984.1 alpha-2,8-polysialyltransferase family protein [Streptomyces sp. NBC_00869]WSZ23517.1 alpha-2,8-polysialyltransferase family protein [Streptomyces sp. NBC_00870]
MSRSRTTQVFLASTLYGTATLAAALDAGLFPDAGRRVLLVANNASVPETTPALDGMPGFDALRTRFDDVVSWNATIAPHHPAAWSPRPDDIPLWERHLRLAWGLGDDDVELAVESIQVDPAMAVCRIFTGVPVDVYADGLMSYGPTRNRIDPLVGTRVGRLLHLDLVPGLRPMLLTEFGVRAETVPTDAFLKVLGELDEAAGAAGLPAVESPALLLGQYLSALGLISAAEEEELHLRMMRGAVGRGHRSLVFKPHPTAPAQWSRAMEEEAARLGAELTVLDADVLTAPVLAEVLYRRMRPGLVVGCFSTALLTASEFYGLPVARVGTRTLLERLTPFENSNRVPVTLVDALVPDLEDGEAATPGELNDLVTAVGFAMQPKIYPQLRPVAERYLAARLTDGTRRYFKRRRLTSLGLPGGVPEQFAFLPRNATVRRVARRARALRRMALR